MNNIRLIVRGAYDLQKLRIQLGNRIVGNFKAKLGQLPGQKESELDAEGKETLKQIRMHYKKITDGLKKFPRQKGFKCTSLISSFTELCLIKQYLELEQSELDHFKKLGQILRDYPIYIRFLENVKGVGPAMAGVLVSEIDISKAEYPSSLWKYSGLDVVDGRGRSRRKEHLENVVYINKEGDSAKRKSLTYNPWLKTKLMGVLAPSFLRVSDAPYRQFYDNYKHRLVHSERHEEKSKGHIHNMAMRYMVKRFLVDLYVEWRKIEGLPVAQEYSSAKLGKIHRIA